MSKMRPLLSCSLLSTLSVRTNVLRSYPSRPCWLQRHQHTPSLESRLPRLAQASFWDSIIPKSLRNRSSSRSKPTQEKPANPATYFIWIYILIGSQAIRIMGIKNEFINYSRKADLKIQQLREVVEKLQRGEDVDVEKILGTGNETQEREWEEALQELQREDRVWQSNRKKIRVEKERLAKEAQDADPVNEAQNKTQSVDPLPPNTQAGGFYKPWILLNLSKAHGRSILSELEQEEPAAPIVTKSDAGEAPSRPQVATVTCSTFCYEPLMLPAGFNSLLRPS